MEYILASASPRRKELLTQAGLAFEAVPSHVKEIIRKEEPAEIVMDLSLQKAEDVYRTLQPVNPHSDRRGYHRRLSGRDPWKTGRCFRSHGMLSLLAGRTPSGVHRRHPDLKQRR